MKIFHTCMQEGKLLVGWAHMEWMPRSCLWAIRTCGCDNHWHMCCHDNSCLGIIDIRNYVSQRLSSFYGGVRISVCVWERECACVCVCVLVTSQVEHAQTRAYAVVIVRVLLLPWLACIVKYYRAEKAFMPEKNSVSPVLVNEVITEQLMPLS